MEGGRKVSLRLVGEFETVPCPACLGKKVLAKDLEEIPSDRERVKP